MKKTTLLRSVAATALVLWSSAFALPPAGTERAGGDPAPRPALLKPASKPVAGTAMAMADTSAQLPSGIYEMRLTIGQKSLNGPVKITRSGGSVTATMGVGEALTGSLDTAGKLQLSGASGTDQLSLVANVQNHRASGSAQLSRGANVRSGSFTLDPETGARKLQEWKTDQPSPATPKTTDAGCGFWCKVKGWLGL